MLAGLTREIDVMEATIVEALRLQTGQLSGYAAQSAKAVTGALDAQTKLQAQIAREVEETRAMRARRPTDSGCAAITGLAGLAATRQAAESAYGRAAGAETGRIAGDRAAVPDAGAAAGNAARFESLTSTYCNGARAGEDAALCRGGDALHAADLKAGNLFDRRTFANEAELRTAVELSRNLTAPVVHDPPALASAETDQERRRILLARSADARAALAGDYFAHARALRAPGAALGAWAAQAAPGRDAATPVSRYELLELLASRRFENPGWFVDLQAMSQENLLRELVTLQAVSLMLDWRRYLKPVMDGYTMAAGKGVHFWCFAQSISALDSTWGKEHRKTLLHLAELVQILGFPRTDAEGAEELSRAIGTATYEARTENRSGTIAENRIVTANTQWQAGDSRALVRERLITPDELMTLGPDHQYVIASPKDMPRDALHLHHARYWRRWDSRNLADPNPFVIRKERAEKANTKRVWPQFKLPFGGKAL